MAHLLIPVFAFIIRNTLQVCSLLLFNQFFIFTYNEYIRQPSVDF